MEHWLCTGGNLYFMVPITGEVAAGSPGQAMGAMGRGQGIRVSA